MSHFISQHIYFQEFMAALAMLGLGLEGYSAEQELPENIKFTSRRTP